MAGPVAAGASGPPPPEGPVTAGPSAPPPPLGGLQPVNILGLSFAMLSSLLSVCGLLIQKHSARVEAGRPLCKRWRFWVGFSLNTGSEAVLSMLALYFCPISLIAPLGGMSIVFNALLTRFGLVCGIKENMSSEEWRATCVVLAGVTLVATAGPGSEDTANIDQERFLRDLPSQLAQPAFIICATIEASTVISWVCLLHLRCLRRWRPAESSLVASGMSGLTASMCGSFSVVLLKIASNWIPMAFRKVFAEDRDQIDDPWGYWLAYLSFFGLCTVAPFQLYLLNLSLASGQATFAIPLYISLLMLFMSFFGGAVFGEFAALLRPPLPLYAILYFLGCMLVAIGLAGLSHGQHKRQQKEKIARTGISDSRGVSARRSPVSSSSSSSPAATPTPKLRPGGRTTTATA